MNLGNVWNWDVVGEVALGFALAAIFFAAALVATWILGSLLRVIDNKGWDAITALLTVGLALILTLATFDTLVHFWTTNPGTDAKIFSLVLLMALFLFVSFVTLGFIADFAADVNENIRLKRPNLAWLPV